MSEEQKKNRLAKIQKENPSIFTGMSRTVRLVLKLLGDKRVNFFLKLLPLTTLLYLISPLDGAVPVIDDALVIGIGTYVFVELCPPEIVEEHQLQLTGLEEAGETARENSEVVDSLFSDNHDQ